MRISQAASPREEQAGRIERGGPRREARPKARVEKTAWIAPDGMDFVAWIADGRRLGAIGRCSQWWIGDWVRYGNSRWGEKYVEAARVTGYDVASLRNMAWVASRFESSLRSDTLTWSHHVLLAPLTEDEQRHWLERASQERFSVADLRIELRQARSRDQIAEPETEAQPLGAATAEVTVCPHCGHQLGPTRE